MRAQRYSHLSHSHGCELTNWWTESQHLPRHPSTASRYLSKLALLRPPTSRDHAIQLNLQTQSVTASKCISKLARLRPPSAFPNSLDYHLQSLQDHGLPNAYLQTRLITASKCIFKLHQLCSPSAHNHGLQVHLHTRSITILVCITEFSRSRPPNVFPNTHDYRHQVHAQTRGIAASECISEFTWFSFSGAPSICSQAPRLQPVPIYFVDG